MLCPHCSKDIPQGSVVCPSCATPLDDAPTSVPLPADAVTSAPTQADAAAEAPTYVDPPAFADAPTSAEAPELAGGSASADLSGSASRSDAGRHGRFLPGTTVAERYRVVGLLGRGGMGEVYRADDLKLGQQVALKFLSGAAAGDTAQVERLIDEVRTARSVSHRNVCRVWDVGVAEGQHYVSMEYVDGEDLASLLRRIGRLPRDKAVEIARQLCAALAAAHEEGVLHRDLKPANIMLDGRGRVKLTDFGLAAVAEVRAGTPIYMAPEQLAGKEVSVRSDLYSLGLVLHELFTGKRVFNADSFDELSRQHQSVLTTSLPTTGELDPAVDRIIHRCLERDPAKRPASALAVAAGLPGADPLAAALAAGETPSPEMVAEAGGEGSLPVAFALPLLLVALIGAVGVGVMQSRASLVGWVPFDTPPVLLDARAIETVEALGYSIDGADTAAGFSADTGYISWLRREAAAPERWEAVAGGRPASILYWWRSAPDTLVPSSPPGAGTGSSVSLANPPRTSPGMVSLQLDTLGRLVWFDAVPERTLAASAGDGAGEAGSPTGGETAGAPPAVDWQPLFERMGLDMAAFAPVPPRYAPDHFADRRVAWEGVFPEDPDASLRIEAAAFDGRPVSVRWFTPWNPLQRPSSADSGSGATFMSAVIIGLVLTILGAILTVVFGGLYVAQRNVRSGRGDALGARRFAYAVAVALTISWLLGEHTYSPSDVNVFIEVLVFVGASSGLAWALYLAVEPFMRRHAPEMLIGWTRIVDGRLADPLVGRDILFGCAAGAVGRLMEVLPLGLGERSLTAGVYQGLPFASFADALGTLVGATAALAVAALAVAFLYGLCFLVLGRRRWLVFAVWLVLVGGLGFVPGITINSSTPSVNVWTSLLWVAGTALWLFVLFRLGILAYITTTAVSTLLASTVPTLDFSAWYSATTVTGLVIFFGLAGYAFFRTVAWRGGLGEALMAD
jgi:serine/threonine-protein kinase